MKNKKVALVLGGGGALGFAHIGVLDILEREGVPVDLIVGTSMGAVIGAGYASGMNISELTEASTNMTVSKMFDFNVNFSGLLTGKRIIKYLNSIYKCKLIEDTPIKFACNAVDLQTCTTHVFHEGDIVTAVRASMSVPAVFTPVKYNGMTLADGGILDNLACDIASNMGYDVIIAVDVISRSVLNEKVGSLFGSVMQSFLIMQQQAFNYQLALGMPADVLITPNLAEHKQYVFNKDSTLDIIELGRLAALDALPDIVTLLEKHKIKLNKKRS